MCGIMATWNEAQSSPAEQPPGSRSCPGQEREGPRSCLAPPAAGRPGSSRWGCRRASTAASPRWCRRPRGPGHRPLGECLGTAASPPGHTPRGQISRQISPSSAEIVILSPAWVSARRPLSESDCRSVVAPSHTSARLLVSARF